jgi:heat shock protein HslJ
MLLGLALAFAISGLTMGADLAGSDWRPSFLSTSDLPAGVHMLVHFDPDGKISGNGGCNQFFGAYSVAGDRIEIGPIASTRKGCPGLIGIEAAFFAILQAAKSFVQEGSTLTLYDAAGIKLAQFVRAD